MDQGVIQDEEAPPPPWKDTALLSAFGLPVKDTSAFVKGKEDEEAALSTALQFTAERLQSAAENSTKGPAYKQLAGPNRRTKYAILSVIGRCARESGQV